MTVKDLPQNINLLSPLNYKFVISRLPNTTYFCQSVIMPDVTLDNFKLPNMFVPINIAGTKIDFGVLQLVFKVDEEMNNYLEIFNWMIGLGFPDDFNQYSELKANIKGNQGLESDGSLIIASSSKNPAIDITFIDLFPVGLTDLVFKSTDSTVNFITATATFAFRQFKINKIN